MNFLYPLFLAGLAAVAAPIVLHMIRRHARHRVVFSSLMFLTSSPPRLRRRSRLEQLPLLLLRCLMLCLLAMIFARPFWGQLSSHQSRQVGRRIVMLVDTSASMQREDLWDQALAQARDVIDGVDDGDRVCVIRYDRRPERLISFEAWAQTEPAQRPALAQQAVQACRPSWHRTGLGEALVMAAETVEEDRLNDAGERPGRGQVVLISDLQQGSDLEALRQYEWPEALSLVTHVVKPQGLSNVTVRQIMPKDSDSLTLRLTNAEGSVQDRFELSASEDPALRTDLYVPAGHSTVMSLPWSGSAESDTLQISGDDHAFGNVLYLASPWDRHRTLLYLGQEEPNDPEGLLFYLKKALASDTTRSLNLLSRQPDDPLTEADLSRVQAVVVGDALSPDRQAWLAEALQAGRMVLVAMRSPEQVATLRTLTGNPALESVRVTAPGYAMLSRLDFQHPILQSFGSPQFMDFTRIHVWQYCRLAADAFSNARVFAWLGENDPAWLALPVGPGLLVVSTFTWQPDQSDLALSSKFVPLLYAMLDAGGVLTEQRPQYYVGDSVSLPLQARAETVQMPSGSTITLASDQRDFSQTDEPGLYTLTTDAGLRRFAVNLHPTESRTASMALDSLEQLGVPLNWEEAGSDPLMEQTRRRQSAVALERGQKIWRTLLCALLVVCFMEMVLAGWLTRSQAVPSGEQP